MFDALYQDDVDRALRLEAETPRVQPKKEPGFFSGLGGASWRGIAQGAVETARSGVNLLEAYGKTVAFTEGEKKEESVDRIFEQSQASKDLGKVARSFDIDAETTGTAGQIVHGLTKFGAKAVGHALVEGPLAPLGFGVDEGVSEGLRLADKGVDTQTAIKAGAVHGVTAGASIALPVAGQTVRQTIGLTVAGGPGAFMGEQAAIHSILDSAGFEDIAKEYDPFDVTGLVVSTLGPGAFGAGAHVARGMRARRAAKAGETKSAEPGTKPAEPGTPAPAGEPAAPREAVDAALVRVLSEAEEGAALVKRTDIEGMQQHARALREADAALNDGRPVDVTGIIDAERADIGRAYDLVREQPQGDAFDPLVLIRPEDIEAVAVSRGGWKGIGDVEVKGQGFGLTKFIWRHGEGSVKPPELQVTREDILAFPEIVRRFHPAEEAASDGSRGRAWRVQREGADGATRTLVYADSQLAGAPGRHLVTVHVQEPGMTDTKVLSKEKPGWGPESPGKRLQAHTGDTQRGFLHRAGQDQSGSDSVPRAASADQVAELSDRVARLEMHTDEGVTAPVEQVASQADEALKAAQNDAKAFEVAVNCLLRG